MTVRRAFEKYMESIAPSTHFGRQSCEAGGEYRTISTERAWRAWQASRQQALEEAAVICDIQAGDHEFIFVDFKAAEGCVGCARAIRSLTSPIGDKA